MEHANDSSRIQSSPTITLSGDGDGWSHNRPLMNRKLGFQLRCTEFVTVIDSIGLRGSESIRMNKHGGSISKIHERKCDVTIRRLNAQCCLPIGSRPNVQRLTMATSSLSLSLSLSLCCSVAINDRKIHPLGLITRIRWPIVRFLPPSGRNRSAPADWPSSTRQICFGSFGAQHPFSFIYLIFFRLVWLSNNNENKLLFWHPDHSITCVFNRKIALLFK